MSMGHRKLTTFLISVKSGGTPTEAMHANPLILIRLQNVAVGRGGLLSG